MAEAAAAATLRETPLAAFHRALGARMVPFAGYEMPVQYPTGIIAEQDKQAVTLRDQEGRTRKIGREQIDANASEAFGLP